MLLPDGRAGNWISCGRATGDFHLLVVRCLIISAWHGPLLCGVEAAVSRPLCLAGLVGLGLRVRCFASTQVSNGSGVHTSSQLGRNLTGSGMGVCGTATGMDSGL